MTIVKRHNMVNMHSYKKFVITIVVLVFNVLASTHLITKYVAIRIYLFFVYFPIGLIGPAPQNQVPIS
jgi:hypothetical protein